MTSTAPASSGSRFQLTQRNGMRARGGGIPSGDGASQPHCDHRSVRWVLFDGERATGVDQPRRAGGASRARHRTSASPGHRTCCCARRGPAEQPLFRSRWCAAWWGRTSGPLHGDLELLTNEESLMTALRVTTWRCCRARAVTADLNISRRLLRDPVPPRRRHQFTGRRCSTGDGCTVAHGFASGRACRPTSHSSLTLRSPHRGPHPDQASPHHRRGRQSISPGHRAGHRRPAALQVVPARSRFRTGRRRRPAGLRGAHRPDAHHPTSTCAVGPWSTTGCGYSCRACGWWTLGDRRSRARMRRRSWSPRRRRPT